MTFTNSENARAVLLPAFDSMTLSESTKRFLDQGGVSILLGESREEYVARTMSESRRKNETADSFRRVTDEAKRRAGMLLAAVDQEMGGICRLHGLVPQFPQRHELPSASEQEIENIASRIAAAAADMGVNLFLSPVLDVLTGPNTWLEGRTWSADPSIVGRLSSAYIRGVQRAGVAAVGKHFPGFSSTTGDPAIEEHAVNRLSIKTVEGGAQPFLAAIKAGVEMIMVGPAIVAAYDREKAALRSAPIIRVLKETFKFRGIILADELDSKATMRGDSVAAVALDALKAGCDYLLLADVEDQLDTIAGHIASAADRGLISPEALRASADRVRALCHSYGK
jgi:beta-N-acetylhexosaminidase